MWWDIDPLPKQNWNPSVLKFLNPAQSQTFTPTHYPPSTMALKLFNLPYLNKININLNLNTQIYNLCFLIFVIFYQKKTFQKIWKKIFSFLRYSMFLFHSCHIQRIRPKRVLSRYVLQLKERLAASSRPFLFFIIFSIKRDCVQRKKSS